MSLKMYLNPKNVEEMIKEAMSGPEALTIDCVRRTPASRPGGPGVGDKHTLVVGKPPKPATNFVNPPGTFNKQDKKNGVKRVYALDRKGWRCVNMNEITFVHFKQETFQVLHT